MFSYKNKRILIVDDQKAFHVMLKTMLTNQGAKNISFADSADSAVKLTLHKEFDIYLVDYNLGSGKNGSQLLDYLKNKQLIPTTSICFIITGDNNKGMVLTAIEKSPDDYLMKPFSQTQLFNRLAKAAAKKKVLADIFVALKEKDHSQAILLCKEKIQSEPKYRGLCKNLLADIFIKTGNYQDAEKILKPMVDNRPLIRASISLGKAYYLQEKYPQTIKLLNSVIENAPLQMEAYQWLARAYQKSNDLNQALTILAHTANMTNHSIERHQEVALLAKEMNDHKVMVSSYSAILQLSRNSFYPDPCHLANYIRSIINYAQDQDDMDERKNTLKQVQSTLYQSRFEEGRNKNFDFNNFDSICQAKVFLALDQPLKAKRKILSTLQKNETSIQEFDNTFLCETLFSLLDIGEFEYATPYLDELQTRHILDATAQASIEQATGKQLESRIANFKTYNQLGIQAFSQKSYQTAIDNFDQALELEPLNSGALLNRIQVDIQLLKKAKKNQIKILLSSCQSCFSLLSNTRLPEHHAKRHDQLQREFIDIKRQHK